MSLPSISVSIFNQTIKHLLEEELMLSNLWIEGELSNWRPYAKGGQVYFSLSDKNASLSAFCFATALTRLDFMPRNGQKVFCRGQVRYFQKRGQFMFQVNYMSLEGAGDNAQQLAKLKQALEAEGLFDAERKQAIPTLPKTVGIITASPSAALTDFAQRCQTYAPGLKLILAPATMQGMSSPPSVMEALDMLEQYGNCDIIVLMRGGGSAEDLAPFNHEGLVRRLADCPIPTISAIGHEQDITLCDFVADQRCATPTAAAQLVTEAYQRLSERFTHSFHRLNQAVQQKLQGHQQLLIQLTEGIDDGISALIDETKQRQEHLLARLTQCNPLHRLQQGYLICRDHDSGRVLKRAKAIQGDQEISLQFSDGTVLAKTKPFS